jgi:hypothetical protein
LVVGAGRVVPHRDVGVPVSASSTPSVTTVVTHTVANASSPRAVRVWRACRTMRRAWDDAAGLGQGGTFTVDALFHLRVVAVVGGAGSGGGFARFVEAPAQHGRVLSGQAAGAAFAVGGVDGHVQSGEADRLAG